MSKVTERLQTALQHLRPDELIAAATLLREEVLPSLAAEAETSARPDLGEAINLLAEIPDDLDAVAALYLAIRARTGTYIRQHCRDGRPPNALPISSAVPTPATPASASPAAKTAIERRPASFGHATSSYYSGTFFTAYPETQGAVWVHHAVEQNILKWHPSLVTPEEMHSLENLRGIPHGQVNKDVHLSVIRKAWNKFHKAHLKAGTVPTKQELLDFATMIDDTHGVVFNPPIRES